MGFKTSEVTIGNAVRILAGGIVLTGFAVVTIVPCAAVMATANVMLQEATKEIFRERK